MRYKNSSPHDDDYVITCRNCGSEQIAIYDEVYEDVYDDDSGKYIHMLVYHCACTDCGETFKHTA